MGVWRRQWSPNCFKQYSTRSRYYLHQWIFEGMVLLQKIPSTLKTFGALSHYLISLQEDFKGILQSSLLCHRSVPRKLNQTDGNEQTKNKRFYANRCQETKAMFAETIQEITSISDKNCGKNYIILCFSPLPPLNNVEGTMSKSCVKQCHGFATLYWGRGEILNTF